MPGTSWGATELAREALDRRAGHCGTRERLSTHRPCKDEGASASQMPPSQASVDDPGVDGLASVQEWLELERS